MIVRGGEIEHDTDGSTPASISTWLDVVERMLRVPDAARSAIRDELEAHLTERVRDLMLAGETEQNAIRAALDELGEAADLAERYRDAHRTSRWRLLMNLMLVGLASGAVVLGTATVMEAKSPQAAPPMVSVFQGGGTPVDEVLPDMNLTVEGEIPLMDAVEFIQAASGTYIAADWPTLEYVGIAQDEMVVFDHQDVPLEFVLGTIESQLEHIAGVEWMAMGAERIELVSQEEADRRDTLLATYVVTEILEHIAWRDHTDLGLAKDSLTALILEFVEPDAWQQNGGEMAQMTIVGGKLFIEAPRRMHERVEWILNELRPADDDEFGAAPTDPWDNTLPADQRTDADFDGTIGVGDMVTVEIYELYEAGKWYVLRKRMDQTGMFRCPEIGEIQAVGATPAEFEENLKMSLGKLFQSPVANVHIGEEFASYTRD